MRIKWERLYLFDIRAALWMRLPHGSKLRIENSMHQIRLIGPWRVSREDDFIVLARSFNKPSGVTDQTKFYLRFLVPEKVSPIDCLLNSVSVPVRLKGSVWESENVAIIDGRNLWTIHFPSNCWLTNLPEMPIGQEHPLLCDAWLLINDSAN
jgi:hypothetical protein